MHILEAAEIVLAKAKKPLSVAEITKRMMSSGLWTTDKPTPVATVGSALYVDIKKGGMRFVKVVKGVFALREYSSLGGGVKKNAKSKCMSQSAKRKEKNELGYVYILTNPCLKGMVKIGRTKRPVNVRSKDLYTSALPTPPEEYISLRTSKFVQVEDLVHRILTKLTRSRVNIRREFFKMSPEEAFEVLKDVSIVLDPDDRCFCRQGKEVPTIIPQKSRKSSSSMAGAIVRKHHVKGVMTWDGSKTQLARLIAQRAGKPGSFGHIQLMFADKGSKNRRRCPKASEWRKPLEDAGVKFDKDDFVRDWKCAKKTL